MIAIHRNGLSGLALRIATIAFAAFMFGCMPQTASGSQTAPVTAAR